MKMPDIHTVTKSCQVRSLPSLSVSIIATRDPKAAPRTPKDEILAFLLARPDASPCQRSGRRPKSALKEVRPMEALKPPSSYPVGVSFIECRYSTDKQSTFGNRSACNHNNCENEVQTEVEHGCWINVKAIVYNYCLLYVELCLYRSHEEYWEKPWHFMGNPGAWRWPSEVLQVPPQIRRCLSQYKFIRS